VATLNLGILAHVDAGKTTLTERLLYETGAIATLGSVDAGSTQTDTLALERARGITIKSAVVSFAIGDTTVNVIDTPGHPDFIAEVERALAVLDGAVLVISAVEGVQPQTRVLWRALQRLRVPTVVFVNKTDRRGARGEALVAELRSRLGLAAGVPVFFGSARTGAGVGTFIAALPRLLPTIPEEPDGPLSARVFKIERGHAGEKVSYVRVFRGRVKLRQRVHPDEPRQKVTGIEVFTPGATVRSDSVLPGQIAKVRGLREVRVGDVLGEMPPGDGQREFGPPTLETTIRAARGSDGVTLRRALNELAEQDPLINIRQDDERHELLVSLYGEVQREVIEATLAADYGLTVTFGETTTVYVERPAGRGEALQTLQDDGNPTSATVGLRVEPAAPGAGVSFCLDVDGRTVPTHIYKSADSFTASMTGYLRRALIEGLHGWLVTDCQVTMTRCGYYVGDGPTKPTKPTPRTAAGDFRYLTPIVLMQALARARTHVCGPMMRVEVECPAQSAGGVLAAVARVGGAVGSPRVDEASALIEARLPAGQVQKFRAEVTRVTSGEGVRLRPGAGGGADPGAHDARPARPLALMR
jgi:ribosomal protection tetracycline resistance protein